MNASARFVEAGSGIIAGSAALPCEPNKGTMARIFVSGSSTGLGLMAGQLLAEQGHQVVLHARNARRADATRRALAGAAVVVGDLETVAAPRTWRGRSMRSVLAMRSFTMPPLATRKSIA